MHGNSVRLRYTQCQHCNKLFGVGSVRRPHRKLKLFTQATALTEEKELGAPGSVYGKGKVEKVGVENIRNFSIIAHIDHGKSTLADQLLIKTHTVEDRDMQAQFLDSMDLERERGITIKLNSARMRYQGKNGKVYALNLIDTPGHVDFTYEVSRSLAACEGALLVVDASQGVEAQTLANVWLALENDLEIIPVLNKIDLPGADPEQVIREIEEIIGLDCSNALRVSAKMGLGIDDTLEAIVQRIPPPKDTRNKPLRALIFDNYYDSYLGVCCQFRVVDGVLRKRDIMKLMNTKKDCEVDQMWVRSPDPVQVDCLYAGEVGVCSASIKAVTDARVGDTITLKKQPAKQSLPGYQVATPMVFCGLFPTDADQYQSLREALDKLQLNDSALSFETETSPAMGYGFRCGFLGLLHMDIIQERLEREYNLSLITTAPTVVYKCTTSDGIIHEISNPCELPDSSRQEKVEEPYVKMDIISPNDYTGPLMDLAQERRGIFKNMSYITESRVQLSYELPLAEVVTDFFDQLKSRSKGYASMEYSLIDYREDDLVKLEIKINGESADPLACIVHRSNAYSVGKALVSKLKELIPRMMFKIPIQAAIGNKVIASESISALRKDVLAKCYGGDVSRKKKLLSKQAEGKKRMKQMGKVNVPQEAFMAVLQLNKD
eukprot:TRINITY_DN18917_c0_g2_i1.p1 TRINITY_DN18917_c0_g2~~TRINITY_DN18917_c0_g2_i1.p1  ORF type:complete len:682 (-),score=102.31 TRINITY_DN18917_c0_g2_i1:218-2203(-)